MTTIDCPNCKTNLSHTEKYIFCPKCGMLYDKHWIIKTAKKLTLPDEDVDKFAQDLCDKLEDLDV